jgi:hypothetical protein
VIYIDTGRLEELNLFPGEVVRFGMMVGNPPVRKAVNAAFGSLMIGITSSSTSRRPMKYEGFARKR